MSTETNKQVVRRFIGAVTSGSAEKLRAVLADDFVGHAPTEIAHDAEEQDRERLVEEITRIAKTLPDLEGRVHSLVAEGDKVGVHWSASGTHEGPFMEIPPTGKRLTIEGMNVLRLRDGKIVEDWVLWDVMGLMRQLGMGPGIR